MIQSIFFITHRAIGNNSRFLYPKDMRVLLTILASLFLVGCSESSERTELLCIRDKDKEKDNAIFKYYNHPEKMVVGIYEDKIGYEDWEEYDGSIYVYPFFEKDENYYKSHGTYDEEEPVDVKMFSIEIHRKTLAMTFTDWSVKRTYKCSMFDGQRNINKIQVLDPHGDIGLAEAELSYEELMWLSDEADKQ